MLCPLLLPSLFRPPLPAGPGLNVKLLKGRVALFCVTHKVYTHPVVKHGCVEYVMVVAMVVCQGEAGVGIAGKPAEAGSGFCRKDLDAGHDRRAVQDIQDINVGRAGVLPVVVTACIGLIPGCGPQIVTVTLYTEGVIPFSALVAHTLSQDGDALFPVIAMNARAAVWATITTTVPALLTGVIFYAFGM